MLDNLIYNFLQDKSPKVAGILNNEVKRQEENIELIASENYPSDAIRFVQASCFQSKYTEGYPAIRKDGIGRAGRYYGGCENYDELEEYCCQKWRQAFNTSYHVNVQPHSGSHANMAAYMSILDVGDKILSMSLDAGGHLSHGASVSFVSKLYEVIPYGLTSDGYINYKEIERKALKYHPKLIVAGASAYSRIIDFKEFRRIADRVGAYLMADIAHIAGLVVSGDHPTPFGLADIITTTTHKSLRGPRGALIFCRPELANKVDSAVFPRTSGGPMQHTIAAKAICAEEACTPEYHEYIHQVVKNSKAMADEFIRLGYKIISGGTDNHLFLLDLSGTNISGAELQAACDAHHITLNKNAIPNDTRPPKETSGVRIGTPAMTSKGYKEKDFIEVARRIDYIIKEKR